MFRANGSHFNVVALAGLLLLLAPPVRGNEGAESCSPQAGTVIHSGNLDRFADCLHEVFAEQIAGGQFSVTVGEKFDIPPHPGFAAATSENTGNARLGTEPGEILGYTVGLPFAEEPDRNDPRAGEKLAWNMRYAYGGDSGEVPEMYWYYRDYAHGRLERTLEFSAKRYNFKHRVVLPPTPEVPKNRYDLHSAILLEAHDPPDVSGTTLLLYYNDDDRKAEQGWMYVPLLRRVRRVATSQRTDAFLGSDIMIEDFLGYSGRIMDMQWEYKGTVQKLLPVYRHDQMPLSDRKARRYDYRFVDFEGPTYCLPKVTWQARRVHLLEGRPIRKDHPLSKREFFVDAETYHAPFGVLYDRAGAAWKFGVGGMAHPDHHLPANRASGVPLLDASAMVDIQSRHCTAIQMVTLVNEPSIDARDFHPSVLDEDGR